MDIDIAAAIIQTEPGLDGAQAKWLKQVCSSLPAFICLFRVAVLPDKSAGVARR